MAKKSTSNLDIQVTSNQPSKKALQNFQKKLLELQQKPQTKATNVSMDDLYRTILESIIWYREGDTIQVKINFK